MKMRQPRLSTWLASVSPDQEIDTSTAAAEIALNQRCVSVISPNIKIEHDHIQI